MDKYKHVDLVVVTTECGERRLFEAPSYSPLKEGDVVKVDTSCGVINGIVTAISRSEVLDGFEYNFIITACGATKPLRRVISKVVEISFFSLELIEVIVFLTFSTLSPLIDPSIVKFPRLSIVFILFFSKETNILSLSKYLVKGIIPSSYRTLLGLLLVVYNPSNM